MGNTTGQVNSEVSRNKLHDQIMTCVYQYLFYNKFEHEPDIEEIMTNVFVKPIDPYASEVIHVAVQHMNETKGIIEPLLNKYKFNRLDLVEQAILIVAYTENHYAKQPKAIAINVAVKQAQSYADPQSYKFINGVLEKICKDEWSNYSLKNQ